jgi:hypothetical protein
MKYYDNKHPLVDVKYMEDGKVFQAIEIDDNKILTMEITCGDYPDTTYLIYDSKKDFVESTIWHDWIICGIKNKNLLNEVLIKTNN